MSEIIVGSRVQWTKRTRQGNTIAMDTLYGAVEAIDDGKATILPDGKTKRVKLAVSSLRLEGEKSQVNDLMQNIFWRNRGR